MIPLLPESPISSPTEMPGELVAINLSLGLEVGKAADLIVLEQNLFLIPVDSIGDVRVLRTMIDGVTVHQIN